MNTFLPHQSFSQSAEAARKVAEGEGYDLEKTEYVETGDSNDWTAEELKN